MRVMHLIKTATGAGWALREIAVLRRLGIEIDVVLAEDGPRRPEYEALGAKTFVLPSDLARLRSPSQLVRARRRFARLIADRRPNMLHSHFVGNAMFARLALRPFSDVPRIFQVPGPLHLENNLTRRAELSTANADDRWIATCRLTQEIYRRTGIAEQRVRLSYYGGVDHVFEPITPAILRRELGFGAKTALIGMVALFYAPKRWLGQRRGLKGHEDLIDATASLRAEGRDVGLVIVGSAWGAAQPYYEQVEAYARQRLGESVRFLGYRSDVMRLYTGFDLAAHPSHSENLGGAGESLAAGTPTIASRTGGHPDVVREGETGFLFEPANPNDLARALRLVLDDPIAARRLAEKGQAWNKRHLHVDVTAPQVAQFYEDIMAGRA